MHILWKSAVFLVALSLIIIYIMLSKAKNSKHKLHYYAYIGGVCGPLIIAAIAVGMGWFGLFFISVFVLFIVSLLMIPYARPVFLADEIEDVRTADVSGPLRFKDFLSWRSIPKLERKYGEHKALAISLIFVMGLMWVGFIILYWIMLNVILTTFVSALPIFVGPFVGSLCAYIIDYRSVKRRLKKQQNIHRDALASDNCVVLSGEQKFCTACGIPSAKDVRYCSQCGKNF